jgi:hypothetical protein
MFNTNYYYIMKKTMITICLALLSCVIYAQHDHHAQATQKDGNQQTVSPEFKDKNLGTAYAHYIHLKNVLVSSQQDDAKKASAELVKALSYIKEATKAHDEAVKVAAASSLDGQRKAFTNLSNEMIALVKGGKLSGGEIYLEYCPMANNNTGGFWLSNEKEIRNPYFGDRMLKCGSVKETIK